MTWHPSLVNLQEAHTYMKDAALTEACSKHAEIIKNAWQVKLEKATGASQVMEVM